MKNDNKISMLIGKYAKFVSKNASLVLMISLILTLFLGVFASKVSTTSMSYQKMLPQDIEEIGSMFEISDEYGISSSTLVVVVRVDDTNYEHGVKDVLEPVVLKYMLDIEKNIKTIPYVTSSSSIADFIATKNDGTIPSDKARVLDTVLNDTVCIPAPPSPLETVKGLEMIAESMQAGTSQISKTQRNIGSNVKSIADGIKGVSFALRKISEGMRNAEMDSEAIEDAFVQVYSLNYSITVSQNLSIEEKNNMYAIIDALVEDLNDMVDAFQNIGENYEELADSLESIADQLDVLSYALEANALAINETANAINATSESTDLLISGLKYLESYLINFVGHGNEEKADNCFRLNILENYVSDDRTMAVIRFSVVDMSDEQSQELVNDIEHILETIPTPAGTRAEVGGSAVYRAQIRAQVKNIMGKTSSLAMLAIIMIVCTVFVSVRYGLLSLTSIIFGSIWVYGIFGVLGINLNPTTSGALSMIMGIGIDFGIQVVNRFRQELRNFEPEKAMEITISKTFYPMLITTLCALIGFRAMTLGKITVLADLGIMMSYGVAACFIAAITVVPSVTLLSEKIRRKSRVGKIAKN